jgi:hypothetical protein
MRWRRADREPDDWALRSKEFRGLRELELDDKRTVVAMELAPPNATAANWSGTCRLWRSLPHDPYIIEPLAGDHETLLLRYAAIRWQRTRIRVARELGQAPDVAATGIALCNALSLVVGFVPASELGWMLHPHVLFDMFRNARLVFLPVERRDLPPEADANWPGAREESMVYVVGRVLSTQIVRGRIKHVKLAAIVERCLVRDPDRRYRSLRELRAALREITGQTGTCPSRGALASTQEPDGSRSASPTSP